MRATRRNEVRAANRAAQKRVLFNGHAVGGALRRCWSVYRRQAILTPAAMTIAFANLRSERRKGSNLKRSTPWATATDNGEPKKPKQPKKPPSPSLN